MKNKKYSKILDKLKSEGNLRELNNSIGLRDSKNIIINDKKYLNLSSNDYLGISTDKEFLESFYLKVSAHFENRENNDILINDFSFSSSSSRSLTGNVSLYNKIEQKLSSLYNSRSSLFFNSGYHANIGIIPAITDKNDLIISDKLNHASIYDGIALSKADFKRYNHLDYDKLETILQQENERYENIIIISESLFSMDGDFADLKRLVQIKKKYDNVILYIDEAHSVGVYGEKGLGVCEQENLINEIDIIVGTFGKALASIGAFIITTDEIKNILINKMRSLIFTTALPPVVLNWNLTVLNLLETDEIKNRRERVYKVSNFLRKKIKEQIVGNDKNIIKDVVGESYIIGLITGSNKSAIELANKLRDNGILVFPIRPPTVPPNSSRVRISLTSEIEEIDLERLLEII